MATLFIGFFIFCISVSHVFAASDGKNLEPQGVKRSWIRWLSTSLHNGDVIETIRLDLAPILRSLATGRVPDDKFTWNFEDAMFYTDGTDKKDVEYRFGCEICNIVWPTCLPPILDEPLVEIYNLSELNYIAETREVKDNNGNKIYRRALTEISVKDWASPRGAICSREESLNYYNKFQERIQFVVSEVKAARQPNGEPLTNEQKLKWVHDWIINNAVYDFETLAEIEREGQVAYRYMYIYNGYGALVEGRTVCTGYARAFKAVVDELVRQTGADIECEEAIGFVDQVGHVWNRVKLNDNWYHVDLTWDDTGWFNLSGEMSFPSFFLVSDYALQEKDPGRADHPGKNGYESRTSATEKATDRRYEGMEWPYCKVALSECTVTLENPDKMYVYNGKEIIPSLVVKYGQNALPSRVYKVQRIDNNKTGVASIKIVPAKKSCALSGSLRGPDFKITKGKISGTAKSNKKYELGQTKSVRPFDKEFRPFLSTYSYTNQSTNIKGNKSLTLKKGTDYTVKYKNNKKVGWATAIITLKGNYTGKITIKYQIIAGNISGTAKSTKRYKLNKSKSVCPFNKAFNPFATTYRYTKRSTNIKVDKSLTLKKGTDYTVKYKNNKKVGWATATITLKGNYTGKITVKYQIVK